jgi:DNA-binding MarR family transcriptional regulator
MASRRLTQLYDDALAPSGLKSTQFAILSELARRGPSPPTMRELADGLAVDRSALGHNLRPLERDGLIALETSETDRRRRHVVLTAEGRARYRVATPHWQRGQERFAAVFGAGRAAALRSTLLGIAYDDRLDDRG